MKITKMTTISGDALKKEIEKRCLKATTISRELGYNDNYIASACYYGKLRTSSVVLLEKLYNIPGDLYIISEPEPEPALEEVPATDPEPAAAGIDYDKLYSTIYEAVYQAVKKAWAE